MAISVLIVDDSPAMRTFIRRVIDLSGFEIDEYSEASDGAEALKQLESSWVDIVLTDINMPQMNGEELVRQMAEHEMLRMIPVVVISTDSTATRIERLMSLGARGYVKKPFLPETLREELERVLEVNIG
jgi:two-component system, chemotaxis family, chemotaxis protein CheY